MSFTKRANDYFDLNAKLSTMGANELGTLLKNSKVNKGWGLNQVISISGGKIFVKRIPITKLEAAQPFSTKNHFNLPTYYNYGVGSAGFGAFRELIGHIKTTNWVLNKEIENFPLMYHYRIVPKLGRAAPINKIQHRKYIERWNNNKNIDRYILARSKATYEIILFLEYFPFTGRSWILANTDKFKILVSDMKKTTTFLKSKGVLHFDLHLSNVLSDGKIGYITDFGLYLDEHFEFSKNERAFFKNHLKSDYDYKAFLAALGFSGTFGLYEQLSSSRKNKISRSLGFSRSDSSTKIVPLLIEHLRTINDKKFLDADSSFFNFLYKNKSMILSLGDFYSKMRVNPKKNTKYPEL